VQVFRNAIIESAAGDVRGRTDQGWVLPAANVESRIATRLNDYMSALSDADVPPPFLVMVAGVRMHGTVVTPEPYQFGARAQPLEKSDLVLPAITLENYGSINNYRQALKPTFDAVWNAAGCAASPSYGIDGTWISPIDN
jgi:hypothetical protein